MAQRFSLFENSIFHSEIIAFSFIFVFGPQRKKEKASYFIHRYVNATGFKDDMNFKTKSKLKINVVCGRFHDSWIECSTDSINTRTKKTQTEVRVLC